MTNHQIVAQVAQTSPSPKDASSSSSDRPFDPWRRCRTPAAKEVISEALRLVQNYEAYFHLRKRKRRAADQSIFEEAVEALLCDAAQQWLVDPDARLMVSLANSDLGSSSRYRSPVMNKTLPDILARLSAPEMEYLEVRKGHQGFRTGEGRRTTINAGSRLRERINRHGLAVEDLHRMPDGEVIWLKAPKEDRWDSGKLLNYRDTDQTRLFRREMNDINAWLAVADISFDEAWSENSVDDQRRQLRRVFNSGSFCAGGRLFGGFWQDLKKAERALGLEIGGKKVVTLDYRQMGPRILYGREGVCPPEDCYAIPRYELFREGWKRLFGALTHTGLELTRFPQGTRKLFPMHLRIGEAIEALVAFHSPIAAHFTPGAGLGMMFTESEILVDLLLAARAAGIVALPVHDAVIVADGQQGPMATIMRDTFRAHVGIDGEVSVE